MKRCKCSPEGALRPQAGVKPLLEMAGKEALKGRQNVLASLRRQASRAGALSPLRGWDYILLFTGVLPLSVLFSGLRPLGRISNASNPVETDVVTFYGIYSPLSIAAEDRSLLYLGAENTLYYPSGAMTIGAFRTFFQLADGITAGEPTDTQVNGVRAFVLNFSDEANGINSLSPNPSPNGEESSYWFTLDGRQLSAKPSQPGLYIYKGKKTIIN